MRQEIIYVLVGLLAGVLAGPAGREEQEGGPFVPSTPLHQFLDLQGGTTLEATGGVYVPGRFYSLSSLTQQLQYQKQEILRDQVRQQQVNSERLTGPVVLPESDGERLHELQNLESRTLVVEPHPEELLTAKLIQKMERDQTRTGYPQNLSKALNQQLKALNRLEIQQEGKRVEKQRFLPQPRLENVAGPVIMVVNSKGGFYYSYSS